MAKIGDNNPPVILELTREEAEFLMKNAETNMAMGLEMLSAPMSEEGLRQTVDLIEAFRPLRDKTKKALAQ